MGAIQPFQPDADYCVFCHRPAAGRCAVCHAPICVECSGLVGGLSRPLAVCRECRRSPPRPGRTLLLWLMVPALVLAGAALVMLLLR